MSARLVLTVSLLGLAAAAQEDEAPLWRDVAPHPRLFLSDPELATLRARHDKDATLQRYVRDVLAEAEQCLDAAELRHELRGPRLLHVSRECLRRVQALGLAWRWTGDARFATRAVHDLHTVAAFPDWNPSHFLDTAEMTHAVALGYDWLLPFLSADDRAAFRGALVSKGLEPGRDGYEKGAWWARTDINWNQVCNSGLLTGALAIAEHEPELARFVVEQARAALPKAISSYEPDGAWMEGPGYWDYATRYTAYGLDALRTALGDDFGLSERDGLRAAAWFPIHTAGPTGLFFNFADAGEHARRGPSPAVFWLARRYGESGFAGAEHAVLERQKAQAMHVAWYVPPPPPGAGLERARLFRGPVPVAVFRSSWDDPGALFGAIKAGYNQVSHGHLDIGSFVVDALGVRWAIDLGSDDYNLPAYWDKKPGGRRWSYYRLRSQSHNVVLVDGKDQDAKATSGLAAFSAERQHAVIDVGSAYPMVRAARRGMALHEGSLLVQDELQLDGEHAVAWGMTTRAEATIGSGGEVVLRQGDERLVVRALAPTNATWRVTSAEQEPPQRSNKGVRRLELHVAGTPGLVRIAVQFAPERDGSVAAPLALQPLSDW